jgi:hypothetical protein
MTDELTPQEKEALKNLPRERMPLGLEARVVEAMREKGFLEKQHRTIEITNSRVAGLLAACVALMIGAYSIGLHRGGGDGVLPSVATLEREDRGPVGSPVSDAPEKKSAGRLSGDEEDQRPEPERKADERPTGGVAEAEKPASTEVTETKATVSPERREKVEATFEDADRIEQPAEDADKVDISRSKVEAAKPTTPPTPSVEKKEADRVRHVEAEGLAAGEPKGALQPTQETSARQDASFQAARPAQSGFESEAVVSTPPLTFILNGKRVLVEAPDSVRVVQDERGRVLVIYTSDGIIRIRLGDTD